MKWNTKIYSRRHHRDEKKSPTCCAFNLFSDDKIFGWSKMKQIADILKRIEKEK